MRIFLGVAAELLTWSGVAIVTAIVSLAIFLVYLHHNDPDTPDPASGHVFWTSVRGDVVYTTAVEHGVVTYGFFGCIVIFLFAAFIQGLARARSGK